MKRKLYSTGILLGMAVLLFTGASEAGRQMRGGVTIRRNGDTYGIQTSLESTTFTEKAFQIPESKIRELKTEIAERKKREEEIRVRYGNYRITEYLLSDVPSWSEDAEELREEEIDMMMGRIISLQLEQLITYDTKRNLSDYYFHNWNIARFAVENPHYDWVGSEDLDLVLYWGAVKADWMNQVTGVIVIPNLYERGRTQSFYTLEDTDKLVCSSSMAHGYYILERCEEEPAETYPEWSSKDSQKLLRELYGKYRVVEFLPTKYYNDQGNPSKEEVDLMMGKTITVSETLFVTYKFLLRTF